MLCYVYNWHFVLLLILLEICSLHTNDLHYSDFFPQSRHSRKVWPLLYRRKKSSYFYDSETKSMVNSRRRETTTTRDKILNYAFNPSLLTSQTNVTQKSLTEKSKRLENTRAVEAVDPRPQTRKVSISVGDINIETGVEVTDISPADCGLSSQQRIVNGFNAQPGGHPWIVVILKFGDMWCGGSIVDSLWIITAAHCIDANPSAYTIRVGTINRLEGKTYKVAKIITHERYNADNMFNSDICLIKVQTPITIGRDVRSICLPRVPYSEPRVSRLVVAGWGQRDFIDKQLPKFLQEVSLPLVSDEECAYKYGQRRMTIYRSQFCTWSQNKDACLGDSGGPAIEFVNGRAFLVGVVSYGSTCADDYPGVFTQLSYFLHWIADTMDNN